MNAFSSFLQTDYVYKWPIRDKTDWCIALQLTQVYGVSPVTRVECIATATPDRSPLLRLERVVRSGLGWVAGFVFGSAVSGISPYHTSHAPVC
jgi:hypothetical protein